ncbi:hypothetical protein HanPI659440_Chr07g0262991 [Helianthus annuus]|nr:hypothetical protein HanPI659440_Chr07g0262991 [Helianthus annuus]
MVPTSNLSIRSIKSISLPGRSHPLTLEIDELLNKIKTTAAEAVSAGAICSGLSQLSRLYKCMDDLLTSSTTQVMMSCEQNKKWVDEFVDESVKFLDVCGGISDMISEIKGHYKDLLCSLRRRKGELSVENSIMKYNCFRKKMKKDIKRLTGSLKQIDIIINGGGGGSMVVKSESDNHQLAAVIKAVIGVSEVTVLVFESLLMFICAPVSKPKKWSLGVSKLMHQGSVACEDQQENGDANEFERTDAALRILHKNGFSSGMRNVQIVHCWLERFGAQIESMEGGLECIFRCLVQTRVSLLNIISL